ncbi:hypothetical protein J4465_01075 [Candidatus Pacearchaeota archaeon]|nr:hypothetical protein [Candidatus Pacearchaeota archaeon]
MITKNKKGFEMSINTIVILVIAVTMLILGIVLVKTIMCGAMNLAASTNEGAQAQIDKLFGEEKGDVVSCMGISTPIDIIPGEYNIIGCGFKASSTANYVYTYTILSANKNTVKTWIPEADASGVIKGEITVPAGQIGYGTFTIKPDDFADEELITIKLTVSRKDAGGVLKPVAADQTIRLNIKRASFIQKGVC